jgi:cytochrome c553
MYKIRFPFFSSAAVALLAMPLLALAADGEAIMTHGAANPAALPCITCHAADGKGMPAAGFPRLAGLPAPYLAKQLRDFKSGARQNPIMQPIAAALTEEEMAAVTQAFAARARVNVVAEKVPERPVQGGGAWLALRGAWERNIPECTLCHGPSGMGVGADFPPLAGQSAMYIEAQLHAWRTTKTAVAADKKTGKKANTIVTPETRRNDPNGLMRHIAADLTEAEIKAVAEYFGTMGDSAEAFSDSQKRLR